MYTQCPECGVAFRVTAEVLKMAAGKVRCGSCGAAFNALEHLSEQKPAEPAPADEQPDPHLPELQPDKRADLEADSPPESISAEQSAALLKTLDELAGEDIRIEDTGVEWRVMEEDDAADDSSEPEPDPDEPSRAIDEMLFDDNTVLPDDFDDVVDLPSPPRVEEPPPAPPEAEAPQIDLDLSQPDEWDDLLGDLDEPRAAEPAPMDDEAPEPDVEPVAEPDAPLDVDTQFEIQAEALGIDLSGIHEAAKEEPPAELELEEEAGPEEQPDEEAEIAEAPDDDIEVVDPADTSIEEDLIAAAFETEAAARALETEEEPQAEEELHIEEELPAEEELQIEEEPQAEDELQIEEEFQAEEELQIEEEPPAAEVDEDDLEEDDDIEMEVDLQVEDEQEIEDDVEDIAMGFDDDVERDIETLSMSLDDEAEDEDTAATKPEDHVIPEMSEEEKTINMMIDQELFNIAVEDEDGFASTIVQILPDEEPAEEPEAEAAGDDAAEKPEKKKKKKKKDKPAAEDGPPVPDMAVETIVMEGDFVGGELDREQPTDDNETEPADTPTVAIPLNREKDDYERRREMTHAPAGAGTWVAMVALVLLLGLQFIHQSREALATVPAINSAIAPVYRMLGQPLTPQWNIGGWRFEATKGDTDETGELLTIYSRVGNNSDEALPYPLVHVSLTDRFEDIIGSALLDPGDYLPEDADPRKPVPPGSSFNAVIAIESPSPEATGFKLNVCYRLAGGQLRCADHDFK